MTTEKLLVLEHGQGVNGMRGGDDVIALARQSVPQGDQHDFLIVHDKDRVGVMAGRLRSGGMVKFRGV